MSIVELYPISSVVWSRIEGYPWWPCKVEAVDEDGGSIELSPFGEDYIYSEKKTSNLKPFAGEEARALVAKGKKKLKNKSKTLKLFENAIQDAVEHLQSSGGDPDFSLGFDPFLDASTLLSDVSQISNTSASARGDMPALDSSIFTPGTCSKPDKSKRNDSGHRIGMSISAHSTPFSEPNRLEQEELVMSDILPKVGGKGRRSDRKKRKRIAEENRKEEEGGGHSRPKRRRSLGEEGRAGAKEKGKVAADGRGGRKEREGSGQRVSVEHNSSGGDELTGGEATVAKRLSYDALPEEVCPPVKAKAKKAKPKKSRQSGQSSSSPSQSATTPPSENTGTASPSCNPLATPSRSSDPAAETDRPRTVSPRQDGPGEPHPPKSDVSALPLQVDAVSSSQDSALSGFSQERGVASGKKSGGDLASGSTADVASTTGVAFEPSLVLAGVSTPTSVVRGTGHWGGDSDDEMHEELSEGSSSSESEDDLPAIDMAVKESVSVSELVPNEVVWAKFDRYPHWPALVVSVTPKRTTKKRRGPGNTPRKPPKSRVIFFGYDDSLVTISTAKNIARFGTKDTEIFMEKGREQKEAEMRKHFTTAVEEARRLLRSRADKEISGDPMQQMKKIVEARPKSYKTIQSPMAAKKMQQAAVEESPPPTVSAFGYRLDGVQDMLLRQPSDDDSSDSESEPEEDDESSSLYTLETVMKSFQELKPLLADIVCEKRSSEFHKCFTGTRKEKRTLKIVGKFGPIKTWREVKKLKLLHFLEKVAHEASGGAQQFSYALDVLLPEAMMRTMVKFENITLDEALERL